MRTDIISKLGCWLSEIAMMVGVFGCTPPNMRQTAIPRPTPTPEKPKPTVVMQEDRQDLVDVPLLIGLEEALQQEGVTPETFLEFTTHQSKTETPTSYQEILITLRCQNADLEEVLQRFVQIGGLNLVIHPGVSGKVTARLERVTWKDALDVIVTMNELSYALEGTVLRVFR